MAQLLGTKTLQECAERIAWAQDHRAQYEPEWRQALEFLSGKQMDQTEFRIHSPLVVNMVWPHIQTALANLWYRVPYVFVKPAHTSRVAPDGEMDVEANSRCGEAVINRAWRNRRMKFDMKRVILDAKIFSCGWIKSGYGSEFGLHREDMSLDPGMMDEIKKLVPEISDEEILNLVRTVQGPQLTEFDDRISRGYAFSKWTDPMCVWIDPYATDTEDARFMVHSYWRQIRSIKQDADARGYVGVGNLQPQARSHPEAYVPGANSYMPEGVSSNKSESQTRPEHQAGKEDPVDGVWLHEYYDKERQDVYVLVRQPQDQTPDSLGWKCIKRYRRWPFPTVRTFPFKCLRLNIVNKRFYPFTAVQQWAPLQKELNLYRSIMADQARRMGKNIVMQADFLQDGEEKKLEIAGPPGVIKSKPGKSIKENMAPVDFGAISPDLYRMSSVIQQDIGIVTGYGGSPNQMGQPNPRQTTATEVSQIASVVGNLTDDELTSVSDFAGDVSCDHFQIVRHFWSGAEMVPVSNPFDAQKWVQVEEDNLRGEFDFIIEVGATQKQSHELRQKRANELMQITLNEYFVKSFGPEVLRSVFAWVLRAYQFEYPEEIIKLAREYNPDPMEGQSGPQAGQMVPNQSGGGMAGMPQGPESVPAMLSGQGGEYG